MATFGRTSVGSTSYEASANAKRGTPFNLPETGLLTKLTAYLSGQGSGSGSQVAKLIVYTDTADPDDRAVVATSVEVTVTDGQAPGWVDFDLSPDVQLSPGVYWLTLHTGNADKTIVYYVSTFVWGSQRDAANDTYSDGPSSPWGSSHQVAGFEAMSIYATYTPVDVTAPAVALTAPADGATVSGASVTVSANASDNVGVAGVTFKANGVTIGSEDTSSPFSVTWDTTSWDDGVYTVTAVARDAAGNTTTSVARTVTVANRTDQANPSGSIRYPAAAATVAGVVPVRVGFTDDRAMASVALLVDGVVYASTSAHMDNLVANGHFEVNTTGWSAVAGATISRETT